MDGCPGGSNKVNALVWQVVIPLRNVRAHLEISTMKSDGGSGLSTVFGMVYLIFDIFIISRAQEHSYNK